MYRVSLLKNYEFGCDFSPRGIDRYVAECFRRARCSMVLFKNGIFEVTSSPEDTQCQPDILSSVLFIATFMCVLLSLACAEMYRVRILFLNFVYRCHVFRMECRPLGLTTLRGVNHWETPISGQRSAFRIVNL